MIDYLYDYRFKIFFATQLSILFGSLLFLHDFFENILIPTLFLINVLAGILLISKNKRLMWFSVLLFGVSLFVYGSSMIRQGPEFQDNFIIRLSVYFIFYLIVTYQIILQIWHAKRVNNTVVMGLMCGYISLGFIAFFLFTTIEVLTPGSFVNTLLVSSGSTMPLDDLMYYAYITLMTIGYGDIIPVTSIAQKATILTGLLGQFYLVIITAIIVGKYLQHSVKKR